MTSYLITGANRGIGFALVKELSENAQNTVVGTTRKFANATELVDLKRDNIEIIELDVGENLEGIKKAFAKSKVLESGVDVVIHNSGVFRGGQNTVIDSKIEDYQHMFDINTLGAVKVFQAVYPYWSIELKAEKKFVFISSVVGSNTVRFFNTYGYGMSKAALNYFVTEAAADSKNSEVEAIKNSTILSIHPGVVSTDMGTPLIESAGLDDIAITPVESAASIIKVVSTSRADKSGAFLSYDGLVIPF